MVGKPAQNDWQKSAESRSGTKEKGSVRTTTAPHTPTKGHKNSTWPTPPLAGEPRPALPLVFQEPFQAQVGRL